jgi:hypothetical protein
MATEWESSAKTRDEAILKWVGGLDAHELKYFMLRMFEYRKDGLGLGDAFIKAAEQLMLEEREALNRLKIQNGGSPGYVMDKDGPSPSQENAIRDMEGR